MHNAAQSYLLAVAAGKYVIDASNESLEGDPAPGVSKQLVVEYTLNGISKKATVPEDNTLNLLTGAIADVISQAATELRVSPEALAAVKPRLVSTSYACDDYVVASAIATQEPFGAKPDGITDCTASVQLAIDAVTQAGGGVVFLPAGQYKFNGSLLVNPGVTLRGDWKAPNAKTGDYQVAGTVLEPTAGRGQPDSPSFITIGDSACVCNLSIWYPDQSIDDVAAYPWTICTSNRHGNNDFTLKNVTLVNCYSGYRIGGVHGLGNSLVQNVYGTPLSIHARKGKMGTPYGGIFGANATNCDIGMVIDAVRTRWQLTSCTMNGSTAGLWAKEGFNSQLQINGCNLSGQAALRSDGIGSVQMQNCTLDELVRMDKQGSIRMLACSLKGKDSRVVIGPQVTRALIVGGLQRKDVVNRSLGDVQIDSAPLVSVAPKSPPAGWVSDRRPATPRLFVVTDFGASSAGLAEPFVGDGTGKMYSRGDDDFRSKYTDDTAAFQKALDLAGAAGGGTVYVPAGVYYFSGCLKVPTAGRGQEDATPFISLKPNSGVRGLSVIYPDQKIETITPYPWTFRSLGPKCWLIDCFVSNPYQLADFGSHPSDGHLIRTLEGSPLRRGIWVSKGSGEVDACDFNPMFWLLNYKGAPSVSTSANIVFKDASKALCGYINANAEEFVFGSCPQTLQINNGRALVRFGWRRRVDGVGYQPRVGRSNSRIDCRCKFVRGH